MSDDLSQYAAKPLHEVTIPLDGGREFKLWLPKPASELTAVEIQTITDALMREVGRRGSA